MTAIAYLPHCYIHDCYCLSPLAPTAIYMTAIAYLQAPTAIYMTAIAYLKQ